VTTSRVEANGINISVHVDGPEDGRPVLLLHGFPDSSYIWRHQVAALTGAGYRTIVPDQRTVLRRGDDMLVVTPRKMREATENRLRAVSMRGRLADWLGGEQA